MEINEFHEDIIDVVTPDACEADALNESTSDSKLKIEINEVDSNFLPPKVEYNAIGEFCFESDELALKGNTDYKNLLEAIVVLEAQRARAVKDLDQLQRLKESALSDPFAFVERMRRKEELQIPPRQKIHPVPNIDWGKYAVNGSNPSVFERRQVSLQRRRAHEYSRNKRAKLGTKEEKPASTNPEWSEEERARLIGLLREYPPEEEETSRWKKISASLGNHTPLEVASKIYEEFTTLHTELGDALGNLPDLQVLKKKLNPSNGEEVCNSVQGSTNDKVQENTNASHHDVSDDEEIGPEFQDCPEYKELLLLKRALREREESRGTAQHAGYKCCRCQSDPIVGTRWRCLDCPTSTDFCGDCARSWGEMGPHTSAHRLEKQRAGGKGDRDYMRFIGGDYNYLDPNYMPAT